MDRKKWFLEVGKHFGYLVLGFVVPVAVVVWPYWSTLRWRPTFLPLALFLFFTFLLLLFLSNQLGQEEVERGPELQSFVDFVLWSGKRAVLAAAIIGALVLFLYFSVPYDPSKNSVTYRLGEALGLYVGIVGVLIGLQFLYWQDHAITDYQQLLAAMTNDLKLAHRNREPLSLVFMAPNIGYFRALDDHLRQDPNGDSSMAPQTKSVGNTAGGLYEEFRQQAVVSAPRGSTIVCHERKHFASLYRAYCIQAKMSDADTRTFADKCAKEATSLLSSFEGLGGVVKELNPGDFPREIVVIGPVCYLLFPHGLPVWKQSESTYEPSTDPPIGGLASLIAYRREDRILARITQKRIEELGGT